MSQAQPQSIALVTKSNWQVVTITVQTWTTHPTEPESIRQLKQEGVSSCGSKDASRTHLGRLSAGNCFVNIHFYFRLKQIQESETETKRRTLLLGDLHGVMVGTCLTHKSCIKQMVFALVLE